METLDDILGGVSSFIRKPTVQGSPSPVPPVDSSLQGAPDSVPSRRVTPKPGTQKAGQTPATGEAPARPGGAGSSGGSVVAGGEPKKQMSYAEMYEMFYPEKPETAEERAKREKREKREIQIAAVGDAISALSNLYFTTQYAPNAYDPSRSRSAATKEKWEKLRQMREANRRAYAEGYMRSVAMDEAREREDRNWRHTLDLEDRNWRHTLEREDREYKYRDAKEQREEKKAEQNELMFQAKYALQMGKLTEQGYRNVIMEIKAGRMEELTDANINRMNRMGTGKQSGDGRKYYGSLPDRNGSMVAYYSKADYEAALHEPWRNIDNDREQKTTSVINDGITTKTTTTTRPRARTTGEKAGEANNKPFDVSKYKRGKTEEKPPLN